MKTFRTFAAKIQTHNVMMQLVSNSGAVLLIGMDIIVFGDFLITNKDGKTTFQFRTPSEGEVEL